jgi:phenylpyruvate tautomerase PptA (4-oxalocrotonate tautomerase family)
MPIVRVDVPDEHPRAVLIALKRSIEEAVARTWARDHIYVAIHPMVTAPGDRSAIVTVDLRPGRGEEERRAQALYRELLAALRSSLHTDPDRFVLLIREFQERCFVVDGGKRLPPLKDLTPPLDEADLIR